MNQQNRYIFPITPQTTVSVTQNTWKIFNIPEVCYKGSKKRECAEFRRTGYCKHTLNKDGRAKKRRLEKYNNYKAEVLTIAKKIGFSLPAFGWAVYFYIPIPKKWSQADRRTMHGQMNFRKPDLSNYIKAFEDALTLKDEYITQRSGEGKFWVDTRIGCGIKSEHGKGWIEVVTGLEVYNPFGVEFIDQSKIPSLWQTSEYKKRRKSGNVREYNKNNKTDVLK